MYCYKFSFATKAVIWIIKCIIDPFKNEIIPGMHTFVFYFFNHKFKFTHLADYSRHVGHLYLFIFSFL